jgi:receptor protein-tyrosine kinase
MSNGPQGLNLIQRAVKRLSDEGIKAEAASDHGVDAVPLPEPVAPRMSDPVRAPRIDPAFRVSAAPGEAEASRREIRLNYAKLRQDNIVTPDNPTSATHDEFRAIKRKLLSKARDGKSDAITRNIVMVTSALPGEGKTFTTINLVISLAAERNLQVLLIDADVVKPSVREFFIGDDQRGLTDLLNGSTQRVNEVVHRCADIPNLSVMFAGRHDARSPELMASRRMAEIFAELSAQYPDRIIVIDSPPVVASPEPTALAMHVHQVVLVVAAEHASRHHVEEALERISACRNISLVFNKSPQWRKAGSSYYYYYRRQHEADTQAG